MAGHRKWDTIRFKGPRPSEGERRAAADAIIDEQKRYARTLAQLRKARVKTQVEVAANMGMAQGEVSRLERRTDAYLSTLQRYVEALGGNLRLVAEFADGEFEIELSSLEEAAPAELNAA